MGDDLVGMVQGMKAAKLSNDYQGAVAKKALDIQKEQNNATMQLLQSATLAEPGSPGGSVNIKV